MLTDTSKYFLELEKIISDDPRSKCLTIGIINRINQGNTFSANLVDKDIDHLIDELDKFSVYGDINFIKTYLDSITSQYIDTLKHKRYNISKISKAIIESCPQYFNTFSPNNSPDSSYMPLILANPWVLTLISIEMLISYNFLKSHPITIH